MKCALPARKSMFLPENWNSLTLTGLLAVKTSFGFANCSGKLRLTSAFMKPI
jgi:hypothetical protein